jgi:lycopene beta-cyclase
MAEALRDRSLRLWSGRGFFRLLNRMLFGAAEPDQSYKVLQHFYRLPSPIIARFYGSRSTFGDKVRILSGRPPVPIGRAVSALLRGAA